MLFWDCREGLKARDSCNAGAAAGHTAAARVPADGHTSTWPCTNPTLATVPPINRYQKLQGRLKEEKRAAKLLRAQLAEERAASAGEAGRVALGWEAGVNRLPAEFVGATSRPGQQGTLCS